MNIKIEKECLECKDCDNKEIILGGEIRNRVIPCVEHSKDIYRFVVGLTQPNSRECIKCMQLYLPRRDYMTLCEECYQERAQERLDADQRPCLECKEMKVPDIDPPWKTLCEECYTKRVKYRSRERPDYNPCRECGLKLLPPDWPEWRVLCVACYRQRSLRMGKSVIKSMNTLPSL